MMPCIWLSRPAVVMQEDWLLATKIATVLVVPLTSNLTLEASDGIRPVTGI
ncbi:MAG: hypothetical protein RI885_5 [Actinomycetota bacterium]|jgi:mRNA interferase MazF